MAAKEGDADLGAEITCGVVALAVLGVIVAVLVAAGNASAKRRDQTAAAWEAYRNQLSAAWDAYQNQLAAAWVAYQEALQRLRSNPGSAELRVQALACGRSYYSLARKDGAPTIYDEIVLANDLNASAGAGMPPAPGHLPG